MIIEEVETGDVKIRPTKQTIDDPLDVPSPFLPKCSVYVISGAMGSGKSSFTNSIMTASGKGKVFRRVFDEVHYITPKEVMASEENHPFKDHPKGRTYHDLSPKTFDKINEDVAKVKEEGGNSCVILDDMSEYLKLRPVELALKSLIFKHRHKKVNIIITLLTLKSLPKALRSLIDCFIVFRPKSMIEIQSFADDVFALPKQDLKQLLDYVFEVPYAFLFYNQRTNTYYKNFTKLKLKQREEATEEPVGACGRTKAEGCDCGK